jgi:hypothetical protein
LHNSAQRQADGSDRWYLQADNAIRVCLTAFGCIPQEEKIARFMAGCIGTKVAIALCVRLRKGVAVVRRLRTNTRTGAVEIHRFLANCQQVDTLA